MGNGGEGSGVWRDGLWLRGGGGEIKLAWMGFFDGGWGFDRGREEVWGLVLMGGGGGVAGIVFLTKDVLDGKAE